MPRRYPPEIRRQDWSWLAARTATVDSGWPELARSRARWGVDSHLSADPVPVIVSVTLDEALMTDDVAVPRSSVYEYARREQQRLPSITVGRHRRFYRSDVEVWLSELR
jgi:excisionase family DNA binding protein